MAQPAMFGFLDEGVYMTNKLEARSTEWIKNAIWAYVSNGQPIPGCYNVEQLRGELERRGEEPCGYHNT